MTVSTFRCTIDSERTARHVYRRHRVPPALSNNVFAVRGERPFSHVQWPGTKTQFTVYARNTRGTVRKRSVYTTRVVFFFVAFVSRPTAAEFALRTTTTTMTCFSWPLAAFVRVKNENRANCAVRADD